MNPLNIIIVNDFAHITGGADYVALTSAIELSKKGHNVVLFSSVNPQMKELNDSGVKVVSTEQYDILEDPKRVRSITQGLWNFKAAKCMKLLLNSLNPANTVIHVHSWTKALSSSFMRVIISKKFKVVVTLHDYFTACPNGGFYNYNTNEICLLKPLSKECMRSNCDSRSYSHKIWRVLRQEIQVNLGLIPKEIINFIYVTEFSKSILEPHLPMNSEYYFLSNPANIQKNEKVLVENNNKYITIGRISREKGMNIFAKAAKKINCEAVFVGDGEMTNEILKIYPDASITGWVNKDIVIENLRFARAVVLPSLLYETLGMSVLEAAALGIPSIVSDTSAASELIVDGVTGLLFKRNNFDDLAEKIMMLQNKEIAKKMGEAAYEKFWSEKNDVNSYINILEKIYVEILNSKS